MEENKYFESYIKDKIALNKKTNKIECTNFLNPIEMKKVSNICQKEHCNYSFWGGFETADRQIAFIGNQEKIYENGISCIRISLAQASQERYSHRNYLGILMSLGIKREMIGDIIVKENGADIVVLKQVEEYLLSQLPLYTRFQQAKIKTIPLNEIQQPEPKQEKVKITVSSLRLDAIVAELAKTSREKAKQLIFSGKVFVNYKECYKNTKLLKIQDQVTIRGKGKFIIQSQYGINRKDKIIIEVISFK